MTRRFARERRIAQLTAEVLWIDIQLASYRFRAAVVKWWLRRTGRGEQT